MSPTARDSGAASTAASSGGVRVAADRVLIVLLGAIGDVTRALPVLARLRAGYPRARIAWAIEPASAPLLRHHPGVDEVIVFERGGGALAFLDHLRRVRRFAPQVTLDMQRHLKSGVVSRASGAAVRLGFHRENSREGNWLFGTHSIAAVPHYSSKLQHFLRFADWLGLPELPVDFGLRLLPEEEQRVEALLANGQWPNGQWPSGPRPAGRRRFLAAYVGSSCSSRLWFPERTAAVCDAVAARGIDTVLVGGPGDVEIAAAVASAARTPVRNLAGRTTLRDLVGIFRRAAAAFGPDSGPMHIAAAAGARVVSLWGATSPLRSAPWANEGGIVQGAAPCSPCYRKECPIGRVCMDDIGVERVLAAVLAAVEPGAAGSDPP